MNMLTFARNKGHNEGHPDMCVCSFGRRAQYCDAAMAESSWRCAPYGPDPIPTSSVKATEVKVIAAVRIWGRSVRQASKPRAIRRMVDAAFNT